jgi:hypothetical protein
MVMNVTSQSCPNNFACVLPSRLGWLTLGWMAVFTDRPHACCCCCFCCQVMCCCTQSQTPSWVRCAYQT